MIRLNQIEVDDNAPAFAKAHMKQENVWHIQTPGVGGGGGGGQTSTLMDHPLANPEIDEWKNGMVMASEFAKEVGMKPCYFRNDNDDDPDNGMVLSPIQKWQSHQKFPRPQQR